jgi:hypothetical protein
MIIKTTLQKRSLDKVNNYCIANPNDFYVIQLGQVNISLYELDKVKCLLPSINIGPYLEYKKRKDTIRYDKFLKLYFASYPTLIEVRNNLIRLILDIIKKDKNNAS